MRNYLSLLALLCAAPISPVFGEAAPAKSKGVTYHNPITQRWRIGVIVQAGDGACIGVRATAPIPADWPEQRVKVVGKEVTPNVRQLRYRQLGGGVKQMEAAIPRLRANEVARAIVVFEVTKSDIAGPADPNALRAPKRPPREVRDHLGPSPFIESRHPRITSLAKEIAVGKQGAWEEVEAMFDWVRANVQYEFDVQLKGAITALHDRKGDCEELTSLFVALCRARGLPARSVWVPGHCYPEFFLEDDDGRGHWFPCQAAGAARQFGEMTESRPILQKGDKFQVPGIRNPQRYVQVTLTAQHAAAPPKIEWVQEPEED